MVSIYSNFISFRWENTVLIDLGTIGLSLHGPIHNSGHLEYRLSTCHLLIPHFFGTFAVLV